MLPHKTAQPPKVIGLLNQPSLLLIGLTTVLSFIALAASQDSSQRNVVYVCWGIVFVFIVLWKALRWYLSPTDFAQNKDVIDIFVKITGGTLVLFTIYFTWQTFRLSQNTSQRNFLLSEKNLQLSEQTLKNNQLQEGDSRFAKALEQLGGETEYHHLAGIYSFKRMDGKYTVEAPTPEQKKEHWEIMTILTHFVQQVSPWNPANAATSVPRCKVEIYEILKYLGERKLTFGQGEDKNLNLVSTDLRGCEFRENANFGGALFREAHLEGATLEKVNFDRADFWHAHLEGAHLKNAILTNVDLAEAHLEQADLTGVTLGDNSHFDLAITDEKTVCPPNFVKKQGQCVKE